MGKLNIINEVLQMKHFVVFTRICSLAWQRGFI